MEARVESARRASEIHKRRTGRSLRVTEQDVINEEMYEEEDDDLPMQYRRLTAHLQTSNADFDRRLAAYLTNHVAMRTALGQAVNGNQFNNPPGYPNPSQFSDQTQQFQQNPFNTPQQPMMPPQNRSPTMYRQSTFQNNPQAYRNLHNRSASMASPQEFQGFSNGFQHLDPTKMEDRRMSMPVHNQMQMPQKSVSPVASRSPSSSNLANLKFQQQSRQGSPKSDATQQMQPSGFPSAFNMSGNMDFNNMSGNPFTTSLPTESQQLLAGAFDSNDPMTAMLMGGSKPEQPFYSYNPTDAYSPKKNFTPSSGADGMNQTLAPNMLDTNFSSFGFPGMHSASTDSVLSPWNNFGNTGYEPQFGDFKSSGFSLSGQTSGQVTPSVDDWSNLIDGNAWEDNSSSQTALA